MLWARVGAVADHEAGEIDGEKARAVQPRGEAENDHRAGGHERRVQALRQLEPVEHQHHGAPAEHADERAQDGLLGQHGEHDVAQDPSPADRIFDQQRW